jgi:hypothetical protein
MPRQMLGELGVLLPSLPMAVADRSQALALPTYPGGLLVDRQTSSRQSPDDVAR